MPIDAAFLAGLVDDDGSNTVGTVWNKAKVAALIAAIDLALTPWRCSAFNGAVQAVPTAAWTVLTLNGEDWDTHAFHSTVTNTSRMTIPVGGDGVYIIRAKTRFAANAAGSFRGVSIFKNGAAIKYLAQAVNNPTDCDVQVMTTEPLVAGNYIECAAYQNTGGNLNIGDAATRALQTELQIVRLGA